MPPLSPQRCSFAARPPTPPRTNRALLQVLNLSSHKRAVVDVQWNLHDGNVIASGASDGSIALSDIRRPHNVIQSMAASEGMSCLRCAHRTR